jgi:NAD(P)-dependent dehydrogenase (short-subunit alcohol dehydrogenase family)
MNFIKGKRVIVTGPTSGVGKEIAIQLAGLGAELILACRDIQKGNEVASEISQRTGAKDVVVMEIDTSSQESIRAFAREFRDRCDRLDVLINNAGGNRGALPKVNSVDGIELTFATNVLGYFLLTQELLPLLKKSAPARIVNVASQYASDLDLDDLQFERRQFESGKAYA